MQYEQIFTEQDFLDFCDSVADAEFIAFDTEFVSEDSYQPDLCLIQVAVGQRYFIIDPHAIEDVTPFWELIASPGHQTIVHAGREEFRFCYNAVNQTPSDLFDIQLASAFVGLEYPAAYGTLVQRLVGKTLKKGETRTNWRRRPLSERQLDYAMQDILYLKPIRDELIQRLDQLDRRQWIVDEMAAWQKQLIASETVEPWRRVSGVSGLAPRSLAVVREIWTWREGEARSRNRPPRRVLRDDLVVELAKRQTADVKRIRALRGMERRDLQRHHETLAECVQRALDLDRDDCPLPFQSRSLPQVSVLAQFLSTALNSICRSAQVAPGLVGTTQDVREFIATKLNLNNGSPKEPLVLTEGWRGEIVGSELEKLLHGERSIRVDNPRSDNPLVFE